MNDKLDKLIALQKKTLEVNLQNKKLIYDVACVVLHDGSDIVYRDYKELKKDLNNIKSK